MANDFLSSIWPDWHAVRLIGKGTYGTVYEAENVSAGTKAAVKVISVPADDAEIAALMSKGMTESDIRDHYRDLVDGFIGEIMVEESLKNVKNIVSIDEYKAIERTDRPGWDIYVRMELLSSLSGQMAAGQLSESQVIDLGIDICSALECYEKMNIVHGDIKPENIFVTKDGRYKLADFSSEKLEAKTREGLTMKDAFSFNAPEVEMEGEYGPSADTYSLGMLLYVLSNGYRMPFAPEDQTDSKKMISAAARRFNGETLPPPAFASADLAQVTAIACKPDPDERFTSAAAMKNALKGIRAERENSSASARIKMVAPPTAGATYTQPKAGQTPAASQVRTQSAPSRKSSPAKIIIPIAIATVVTALIVAAAIIFIPKLFQKTESVSAEESVSTQTRPAEQITTQAAAETTAAAATENVTEGSQAESSKTEVAARVYQKGDIISFGHYEQDGNEANGKEAIEWLVLDVQDDRVFVISRYGLDSQQYDSSGNKNVSWQNCTLRGWLNSNFYYDAFDSEEQGKVLITNVTADRNPQHTDRDPGNDTSDKVFLLSTAEAEKYFSSDKARIMQPTSYAIARGVTYCNNKDNQGYGYWWWLRSPGRDDDYAALVFPEGAVDYTGYHYNDTENAVRPAMWITP